MNIAVTKQDDERHKVTMDQQIFLKSAAHISLRADEKAMIREALMTEIEKKEWHFHGFLRFFSGSMAAIMLFVLCGAGVSYAAESALPGDILYPVKVHFTEAILLRMNASVEAKVRVRARLTSRRLEETEKLAAASLLNAERIAIVEERLAVNVAALEVDLKELATLNKQASADIAIDTAAEIEAHESLLLRIVQEKDRQSAQKLVDTAAKARRLVENAASAVNPSVRINILSSKAEQEIRKAKSDIRAREDADVANALLDAEVELSASLEKDLPQDSQVKKSNSALRKAKEANAILRLPKNLRLTSPPPRPAAEEEVAEVTTASASSANSSGETSSASDQSSSEAASSKSSSSRADTLKNTDDIIKKSVPSL